MALSLRYRPRGFISDGSAKVGGTSGTYSSITITNSGGFALITSNAHGLANGNTIYLEADILAYCGFWTVDNVSANTFNISEQFVAGAYIAYVGTCSCSYSLCQGTTIAWNAVHNLIMYRLGSDLWPTNSVDTIRTISSIANDNGYVQLTLSGALKATVNDLEFVKIVGANAGVYQILTAYSTSIVTINYPYVTGLTFPGSTVQFYYNNYHARVRIYAGLAASHGLATLNPSALISEIKAVPDSLGVITFFIQDDVKKTIDVHTNTILFKNLFTSPGTCILDWTAYTQFYIEYAESYDDSDGYTLGTFIGSYTTDPVKPYALNAQMPFGSKDSGFLTPYIGNNLVAALRRKFLTTIETPFIYPGQYFDIGLLIDIASVPGDTVQFLMQGYDANGVATTSTSGGVGAAASAGAFDSEGVVRCEVRHDAFSSSTVRVDVYGYAPFNATTLSELKSITLVQDCTSHIQGRYIDLAWKNSLGTLDFWRFEAFAERGLDIEETQTTDKNLAPNWPRSYNAFASTMKYETKRTSRQTILLRAENLTSDQVNAIFAVKSSIHVMMMSSRTVSATTPYVGDPKMKTVLPDADSFPYLDEALKLHEISFTISLTNEMPVQKA